MATLPRKTRSVCPVCLTSIPALLEARGDQVLLRKTCPRHGTFSVPVWRGQVDFDLWTSGAAPLGDAGQCCPQACGLCQEHESGSCCVLLEVTRRCNLRCRFCFASGGQPAQDPPLDALKADIRQILSQCGTPLLQLSGGEPTLRDDLPELIAYAKAQGCAYVQLNTNGLRLAREPDFTKKLAQAGLDIVFLQFDGVEDSVYRTLREKPLLAEKSRAIQICGALGLGVTLVPTVVPGVNTQQLGALVDFAKSQIPYVRGIHFQPVSYFGRHPGAPEQDQRYTLDQLMADLSRQTGLPLGSFLPSRCDHPLCGFHCKVLVNRDGSLRPLATLTAGPRTRKQARDNREYVAQAWRQHPQEPQPPGAPDDELDFDTFLYRLRHQSLTLSAMAFQDAMNLNIERLHRCSLHVYNNGRIVPFCANYLTKL